MLGYVILSQSRRLVYFSIIVMFVFSTNVVSVVLALAILLYSLVDHPVPRMGFWQALMVYLFVEIAAKFVYQFPIFCNSPAYTLYALDVCSNETVLSGTLVSRIDFIIGIHKFSGPASPYDVGTLWGIFPDFMVLLSLFLHKNYLINIGVWNYV
mmetsp:Transcript_29083/g.28071  ORF Transcript_29083/g.28071 Transcript_29083/m.28071 type:complete len:154 (+) Transcript_29083:769-1230(+)